MTFQCCRLVSSVIRGGFVTTGSITCCPDVSYKVTAYRNNGTGHMSGLLPLYIVVQYFWTVTLKKRYNVCPERQNWRGDIPENIALQLTASHSGFFWETTNIFRTTAMYENCIISLKNKIFCLKRSRKSLNLP